MAKSGCSDKIQVKKETTYGDGGITDKVFGITKSFNWKVETSTQQQYGLETNGPEATKNTDGVISISGTHEWELTNGQCFEAITGSYAGTSPYTFSVSPTLPSYSIYVAEGSTTYNIIKGVKYTKFAIKLARGEDPITVTADWIGKTIETTGTFTPTTGSYEPLMYLDGYFTLGSTAQTEVEDFTLEIDRKCQGRRFIESTASGSRRLISTILEGPLVISYSGNMAAKRAVIEEIWGSTTLQDTRSDKNVVLYCGRGTQQLLITVTGGRHISSGRTLQKDQEVSIMDFAGVGINVTGSGTYA